MFISIDENLTPLIKNYSPSNLFATHSNYRENNNFVINTEGNQDNVKYLKNLNKSREKFKK